MHFRLNLSEEAVIFDGVVMEAVASRALKRRWPVAASCLERMASMTARLGTVAVASGTLAVLAGKVDAALETWKRETASETWELAAWFAVTLEREAPATL